MWKNNSSAYVSPYIFQSNIIFIIYYPLIPYKCWSRKSNVQCSPEPDDLNPCEDIMGRCWLRISVWIVGIGALLSNFIVLLVVLRKSFNFSVPRFLMSNLAFADFCSAVYLLLLAYEDFASKENYFNYAFTWQNGTIITCI